MPPARGLQTGIPTGQPNSTVLMSSPIRFRSSLEGRFFSHSRTGSPPAAVRKKIAGTRLPSGLGVLAGVFGGICLVPFTHDRSVPHKVHTERSFAGCENSKEGSSVGVRAAEFADNVAYEAFGVAEEHEGFFEIVERVVDA